MAFSERFRRQAEPVLNPVEVGVNAIELMKTAEAAHVGNSKLRQEIIDGYAERGTSYVHSQKRGNLEIQFHTHIKRGLLSTRRKVGVRVQYPDSQDPSITHIENLKLSYRKSKQNPKLITAVIKTNLDGVRNRNNRTAIQNAQRFVALLS